MDIYPTGLSPDAELVLSAIEKEIRNRTPTPALLNDLAPYYRNVVPDHLATIESLPKLPGGRRTAVVRYKLIINVPRIASAWVFTNGWLIRRLQKIRDQRVS